MIAGIIFEEITYGMDAEPGKDLGAAGSDAL
jgi:hypothetical protein